jgi:hypothetical protein
MTPVDQVRAALIEAGLGDVVLELTDSARTGGGGGPPPPAPRGGGMRRGGGAGRCGGFF